MKTSYDKSTASLYIEARCLPSRRTVELQEDVMLDLGEDGQPVGCDIRHASTKKELIGRLILEQMAAAAECQSGSPALRNPSSSRA